MGAKNKIKKKSEIPKSCRILLLPTTSRHRMQNKKVCLTISKGSGVRCILFRRWPDTPSQVERENMEEKRQKS